MPQSKIQFQVGLSLVEFNKNFKTEKQCIAHLESLKWPEGITCEACGNQQMGRYQAGNRMVYQCKECRHRQRLTAGTLFHRTKVPLLKWFMAIREITQSKNSISALELHRHLDVNYKTAWLMKHKIMQIMYESEKQHKLTGAIELSEGHLGKIQKSRNHDIILENTPAFLAAIQYNKNGHPSFVKFSQTNALSDKKFDHWAKENLEPNSFIYCKQESHIEILKKQNSFQVATSIQVKSPTKAPWLKIILRNVKSSISGTFHSINYQKYGYRYLADLGFRLNHRFDLKEMFYGLLRKALRANPKVEKNIHAPLTG